MAIRRFSTASISTGSKSSKFWDQSAVEITTAYESIATLNLSGTSNGTFSSIPQTYKHLQIRYSANIPAVEGANFQFNGDAGTNYVTHYLFGSGSGGGTAASSLSQVHAYGSIFGQGYDGGTYTFAGGIIDILDYTNTSKNKTIRSLIGVDRNGTGGIHLVSSLWRNTAAISSIKFLSENGSNLATGTKVALYGIKG